MGPIVHTFTRTMPCHRIIFQIGEHLIVLDAGFGVREMLEPNRLLGDDALAKKTPNSNWLERSVSDRLDRREISV
jgi:hypothetical protein